MRAVFRWDPRIMKPSLWDLKPGSLQKSPVGCGRSWSHPYGIWNTSANHLKSFIFTIMKPSLWDLKLFILVSTSKRAKSWSHPYGIWNAVPTVPLSSVSFIMKPSLWDLKPILGKCKRISIKPSWSHPYGIWNAMFQNHKDFLLNHEAIPMGFETKFRLMDILKHIIMKPSLWDLKLF